MGSLSVIDSPRVSAAAAASARVAATPGKPCDQRDPELYFPLIADTDDPDRLPEARAVAQILCDRCPVAGECLIVALAAGPAHQWGVFGGMVAADRRSLLVDQVAALAEAA